MFHGLGLRILLLLIPRFLPRAIRYIILIRKLIFDRRVNIILRALVPLALIYSIVPFDMARLGYIGRFDEAIVLGLAAFITVKLAPQDIKNEHLGIDPRPKRPEDDDPSNVVDGSSRNMDDDEQS